MSPQKHWLLRPRTIRMLLAVFCGVLILTLIPDLVIHQHDEFGMEGWPGFYALFGFITCVAMIVVAKVLGVFLSRPDNYYEVNDD